MRTLKLEDGTEWQYKIGTSTVVLRSPDGKSHQVGINVITGRTWDIIERGKYKKTSDGMVTPSQIRQYVDKLNSN